MLTKSSWQKIILISGLILITLHSLTAQEKVQDKFRPHFQVGINGGSSVFFGDIKQNTFWPALSGINELHFAGGLNFNFQVTPAFAIRLHGLYGKLSGMRKEWDVYFQNDYIESNINAVLNFSNIFGKVRTDRLVNIYGTIGIGLTQYNTVVKSYYEGTELMKVGYGQGSGFDGRTLQGIMLYGLGLDFRLNERLNLQLESTNRVMDSDMLDGRATGYPLDFYNYTSIGITFKFGFLKQKETGSELHEEETAVYYEPEEKEDTASAVKEEVPIEQEEEVIPADTLTNYLPSYPEEQTEELPGLEYRVQILARFQGPVSLKFISTTYSIPMYELKEDTYQGHRIYTIGSYKTYQEARKKRDELRSLFGITDAFVVAFDKGVRLDQLPEAE